MNTKNMVIKIWIIQKNRGTCFTTTLKKWFTKVQFCLCISAGLVLKLLGILVSADSQVSCEKYTKMVCHYIQTCLCLIIVRLLKIDTISYIPSTLLF